MKKALEAKKAKKPRYYLETLGIVFGISMFLISISYDEKESATGNITYNDEGLVSFQSHYMEAFYGLLMVAGCVSYIVYKKRNS